MSRTNSMLPPIDAWTASSLLQKAIRRNEQNFAQAAALVLYRLRGAAIWRRLTLIVHEDVGIGDLALCAEVTRYGSDPGLRRQLGSDDEVILDLVSRMCAAAKNREPDYLVCTVIQAEFAEALRASVAGISISAQVQMAADPTMPLLDRAMAVWQASGVNGGGPPILSDGNLPWLMQAFDEIGLPQSFSSTVEVACRKTREPIVMMVPLLWAVLHQRQENATVATEPMPASVMCGGLPSYVFDKHTSLGKQAIRQLLRENTEVRNCINDFVPEYRALDAAYMSAFYADAISLARRAVWSHSNDLYALGRQTDMTKVGVPEEGVAPIADILLAHLDHLNDIRRRLREGPAKDVARSYSALGRTER